MRIEDRDYREVLEPGRRRKALLYRAALACVVMLLLVVGLTLYDEAPEDAPLRVEERTEVAPAPLEVVPSPVERVTTEPTVLPEDAQDEIVEGSEEAQDVETEGLAEEDAVGQEGQTVGQGANDAAPVTLVPESVVSGVESVSPPSRAQPAPRRPAPAASVPASQSGYLVRLGDYADTGDVQRVVAELQAAGHPARSQWRVSAGTYPTRAAAVEAMRALERSHRQRGLVVQLPAGSHVVQLGVFGEIANADGLARRVRAWGYPVVRDARIVLGPYAERSAADAAVAELGQARGLQAVVVAPGGR